MARFQVNHFPLLEKAPTSAAALRTKLSEMLISSTSARLKVESINPTTGEYRIVVQGTIDTEKIPFEGA
jgi:hypothetical protein